MADKLTDNTETAFPASAATPGQTESRRAREAFLEERFQCPWWRDYLDLRLEGWDWRKAAYIAWMASPGRDRWPENQEELAKMLGLKSDRVLRKWREKDPTIDERVGTLQIEPLFRKRRDMFENLAEKASGDDKFAFQYMKIWFDFEEKRKKAGKGSGGSSGGSTGEENLSDEELEQKIKNLQMAFGKGKKDAGDQPDSDDLED